MQMPRFKICLAVKAVHRCGSVCGYTVNVDLKLMKTMLPWCTLVIVYDYSIITTCSETQCTFTNFNSAIQSILYNEIIQSNLLYTIFTAQCRGRPSSHYSYPTTNSRIWVKWRVSTWFEQRTALRRWSIYSAYSGRVLMTVTTISTNNTAGGVYRLPLLSL